MKEHDSKTISHQELTEELISTYGADVKEDFERIAMGCCEPYEWVPIEGTDLLIGITPLAGGALKCCKCQCSWSLNYFWISLPRYAEKGDVKSIIANSWEERDRWWECPCCSYEASGS